MSERSRELLTAAALAYEDGRDPFSIDFLVEREVTVEEYMTLSHEIGTILMGALVASEDLRNAILLLGAVGLTNRTVGPAQQLNVGVIEATILGRQAMRKLRESK